MNGLNSKWENFINVLKYFDGPSCVMLQETKLTTCLKSKLKGYVLFPPDIRKRSGIVLTAVASHLSPIHVPLEVEDVDIVVVEAVVGNQKIRLINAYGSQETESKY